MHCSTALYLCTIQYAIYIACVCKRLCKSPVLAQNAELVPLQSIAHFVMSALSNVQKLISQFQCVTDMSCGVRDKSVDRTQLATRLEAK